MKDLLLKNFLKYVSYDTQSMEESTTFPSTLKQLTLGEELVKELKALGIENASMTKDGYVNAFIKGTMNTDFTLGLIAHMDTSPDASGKDVKPNIIDNYDGSNIVLKNGIELSTDNFNELKDSINHTLITTDGTTLLGADDKAGIAVIMTLVEELLNSNVEYPNLIVSFTPDEEIGMGTEHFDYDFYNKYNCKFAYTLDGGRIKDIEYENFNAAACKVTIHGKSIHPGSAKNKMINAIKVAYEFINKLPKEMAPEYTEGYEGFNHPTDITGCCEEAVIKFIIRNHDLSLLNNQKELFVKAMNELNLQYGYQICDIELKDQYLNMKEHVVKYPFMINYVKEAMAENGIVMNACPIRGGTDGARLTYEGIITPNLGTGAGNFHGPYEYLDVTEACQMVKILKSLIRKFK